MTGKAFEQWFEVQYIKTGFVCSKAEMETAWKACAEHYEDMMRRAVDMENLSISHKTCNHERGDAE